jgi:hypothetical protein
MFDNVERVAAAVAGLCLFTLNDLRLFQDAVREPADALMAAVLHVGGAPEAVYLSALDFASRWGLAGLTLALGAWAIAETLQPAPGKK